MQIRLKRAYEEPNAQDGTRILVDRLWPRGVKKEDAAIDFWMKGIAPSSELRKWIHADPSPERWQEFRERYFAELDEAEGAVREMRERLSEGRVTLVYAAKDTSQNHALVLKEYLESLMAGKA